MTWAGATGHTGPNANFQRAPQIVLSWPARRNAGENPFQKLLSDALQDCGWDVKEFGLMRAFRHRGAVWHWHWVEDQVARKSTPHAFVRYVALRALMVWGTISGAKIVVTAHNLGPHNVKSSPILRAWMQALDKRVDGVHYLSESSRESFETARPLVVGKPCVVTRHGHYRAVLAETPDPSAARRRLELEDSQRVIATVGKLRPYKGVFDLLEAMKAVEAPGCHIVVAGEPEDANTRGRLLSYARYSWCTVIDRRLDDEELLAVVSASDLVVLPYRNVLNSGSALYALSANRPIAVPSGDSFRELAGDVGHDWVQTFDGPVTPASLLKLVESVLPGGTPDLSRYEWNEVATRLGDLYNRLQSGEGCTCEGTDDCE